MIHKILSKLEKYIKQEDITFTQAITNIADYLNQQTGCGLYALDDEYIEAALDDLLVGMDQDETFVRSIRGDSKNIDVC